MADSRSSRLQRDLVAAVQAERPVVHVVRLDDEHHQLQHHARSDGDVHRRADPEQHGVGRLGLPGVGPSSRHGRRAALPVSEAVIVRIGDCDHTSDSVRRGHGEGNPHVQQAEGAHQRDRGEHVLLQVQARRNLLPLRSARPARLTA